MSIFAILKRLVFLAEKIRDLMIYFCFSQVVGIWSNSQKYTFIIIVTFSFFFLHSTWVTQPIWKCGEKREDSCMFSMLLNHSLLLPHITRVVCCNHVLQIMLCLTSTVKFDCSVFKATQKQSSNLWYCLQLGSIIKHAFTTAEKNIRLIWKMRNDCLVWRKLQLWLN